MPCSNCTVSNIKKLIKKDNIKFDNHENYIPYTNGKVHVITGKLEPIFKEDYFAFIMGYKYYEERNEKFINYYHQIYVDILRDDAEQVERFIAYWMTRVVKYRTNFLFNLGKEAANGKSTITNIYKAVLPLYWTKIHKEKCST